MQLRISPFGVPHMSFYITNGGKPFNQESVARDRAFALHHDPRRQESKFNLGLQIVMYRDNLKDDPSTTPATLSIGLTDQKLHSFLQGLSEAVTVSPVEGWVFEVTQGQRKLSLVKTDANELTLHVSTVSKNGEVENSISHVLADAEYEEIVSFSDNYDFSTLIQFYIAGMGQAQYESMQNGLNAILDFLEGTFDQHYHDDGDCHDDIGNCVDRETNHNRPAAIDPNSLYKGKQSTVTGNADLAKLNMAFGGGKVQNRKKRS